MLKSLVLSLLFVASAYAAISGPWVMGYIPGYEHNLLTIQQIPYQYMTHLAIGRFVPLANGSLDDSMDWYAPSSRPWAKNISTLCKAAGCSPIAFLGGAGATHWQAASQNGVRATFVSNLVSLLNTYGFDGWDIDWEPMTTSDAPLVLALLQDLRAARPNATITMPIGWVNPNLGGDTFYSQFVPYVDKFAAMTYDMAGGNNWGWTKSWFTSALQNQTSAYPSSISGTLNFYTTQASIPKSKMSGGLPAYGNCWTGVNSPRQTIGTADVKASDQTMSFTNIMNSYYNAANYHYDQPAASSWLGYNTGTGPQACTWISYDDQTSAAAKGTWIKDNSYGGIIVWTVTQAGTSNWFQSLYTAVRGSATPAPTPTPSTTPAPSPKTTPAPSPKTTPAPSPKTTPAPSPKVTPAPTPVGSTPYPTPAPTPTPSPSSSDTTDTTDTTDTNLTTSPAPTQAVTSSTNQISILIALIFVSVFFLML